MARFALVGIGDAGKHHARALSSLHAQGQLAWTAVVARDPARLEALRSELAVPSGVATFTSYDALLAASVCDAVVLATPDGLHASQVEAAADRGLHVLVEKPFALTRPDAARALAAAAHANVHLSVGYHLRHHGAHRLALARMRDLVGIPRAIYVRWAWPDPATTGWRARGDGARSWSLAALGTHGVDLALFFGGGHPSAVVAVREPRSGPDHAAEVSFALPGGVLAHVSVSVAHRAVSRVLITGEAGEIEALGTLGARGDGALFARGPRAKDATPLPFEPGSPYMAQLLAFVARTKAGFTDDPSILANVDVLDAILGPVLPGPGRPGEEKPHGTDA